MPNISQKTVINPVIVLRKEFDNWAVLYNPDTAEAVGINPVGVEIWELLAADFDLAGISAVIRHQYADVPDDVEAAINSFIKELAQHGFVAFEPVST